MDKIKVRMSYEFELEYTTLDQRNAMLRELKQAPKTAAYCGTHKYRLLPESGRTLSMRKIGEPGIITPFNGVDTHV